MKPWETLQYFPCLKESTARLYGHAEHISEHGDSHLDADTGEKSNQHGARQKIGEKSQLENARNQQQDSGQQRYGRNQRDVFLAAQRGHTRKRTGEDGRGCRICRHDQVARRTKYRECDQRQQNGIESGDDRRAGDARIAEHLRDVYRGECHTRQGIAQRPGSTNGTNTSKEWQPHDLLVQLHRGDCPLLNLVQMPDTNNQPSGLLTPRAALPPPRLLRSHPSSGRLPPPRLLRSHPSSGRRGNNKQNSFPSSHEEGWRKATGWCGVTLVDSARLDRIEVKSAERFMTLVEFAFRL